MASDANVDQDGEDLQNRGMSANGVYFAVTI